MPGRGARLLNPPDWPDHFSGAAERYARYRPDYPASLFDGLAALAPGRALAWDCATGTGQAAAALAQRFTRVVATDASARQVAAATTRAGIAYAVALAEAAPLGARRVDLVTVAQAAHWLRLDEFYDEARRVLRPGGVLAMWCYGLCAISPDVDRVLEEFYHDTVGRYWPPQRSLVESGYREIPFPFTELSCRAPDIERRWTRAELLGYVDTWSAVKRYREERGEDPVETVLAPRLRASWAGDAPAVVRWPLGLRVGRA